MVVVVGHTQITASVHLPGTARLDTKVKVDTKVGIGFGQPEELGWYMPALEVGRGGQGAMGPGEDLGV